MATRRSLTGDANVTPAVVHKQLESSRLLIAGGEAVAPDAPGLGIDWRFDEIERRTIDRRSLA